LVSVDNSSQIYDGIYEGMC